MPAFAAQPSADELLAKAEQQAADKQFDAALKTLKRAARIDPADVDVQLEIARVLGWQGHYGEAQKKLQHLAAANPDDTDIPVALAYNDFYRGDFDAASNEFGGIVQAHPDNADAADGLKLAQNAAKDAEGLPWQLDAGYEHSDFARQPVTPWNGEFAQLARSFDGGATVVHGRFEYDDEYETNNDYVELGADHRFTPWANAYFYAGHTFEATYRPRWRVEPGGNLRVFDAAGDLPAAWLTLDVKQDDYGASNEIATADPGIRLEKGDWAFSPNLVAVKQWGLAPLFGWNARLDGPIADGLRFYVGYADAPETENAITVYTITAYGGLSYDIDDAHALSLGYTHDDRHNSWIRHAVDLAFTDRF